MDGLKRTSVVSTSTTQPWERATPKEGFDITKPQKPKTGGPAIRNMLNNLHPEKD
jgi:hypothetical protein